MKLQVGCSEVRGRYKRKEWINIDLARVCDDDGMDVLGDGIKLPFKDSVFDEVVCVHVLEHVTRDKPSEMMSEMYRVLKSGGVLHVEVPDFKGVVANLTRAFMDNNRNEIHIWTTSVYGKNERPGMAHHWGFDGRALVVLFRKTGFQDVRQVLGDENMISRHYLAEPIILMKGTK